MRESAIAGVPKFYIAADHLQQSHNFGIPPSSGVIEGDVGDTPLVSMSSPDFA